MRELANLGTATISDALDMLNLDGGCRKLRSITPGGRCVGLAYTIKFVPVEAGEQGPAADYIDDVPGGSVVVLDNGGLTHCTVWGDLLTACALSRGVAGTVIDGCCRDSAKIRSSGYPLFARCTFMKSGKNRVRMESKQVPVTIGGTVIHPGDIIVCDDDGVLAVPAARAVEVAEVARGVSAMEERMGVAIAKGVPLHEARHASNYNQFAWKVVQ
jgi:4-hydroxy-4-methyl-2-oxoglutarate aldolase